MMAYPQHFCFYWGQRVSPDHNYSTGTPGQDDDVEGYGDDFYCKKAFCW